MASRYSSQAQPWDAGTPSSYGASTPKSLQTPGSVGGGFALLHGRDDGYGNGHSETANGSSAPTGTGGRVPMRSTSTGRPRAVPVPVLPGPPHAVVAPGSYAAAFQIKAGAAKPADAPVPAVVAHTTTTAGSDEAVERERRMRMSTERRRKKFAQGAEEKARREAAEREEALKARQERLKSFSKYQRSASAPKARPAATTPRSTSPIQSPGRAKPSALPPPSYGQLLSPPPQPQSLPTPSAPPPPAGSGASLRVVKAAEVELPGDRAMFDSLDDPTAVKAAARKASGLHHQQFNRFQDIDEEPEDDTDYAEDQVYDDEDYDTGDNGYGDQYADPYSEDADAGGGNDDPEDPMRVLAFRHRARLSTVTEIDEDALDMSESIPTVQSSGSRLVDSLDLTSTQRRGGSTASAQVRAVRNHSPISELQPYYPQPQVQRPLQPSQLQSHQQPQPQPMSRIKPPAVRVPHVSAAETAAAHVVSQQTSVLHATPIQTRPVSGPDDQPLQEFHSSWAEKSAKPISAPAGATNGQVPLLQFKLAPRRARGPDDSQSVRSFASEMSGGNAMSVRSDVAGGPRRPWGRGEEDVSVAERRQMLAKRQEYDRKVREKLARQASLAAAQAPPPAPITTVVEAPAVKPTPVKSSFKQHAKPAAPAAPAPAAPELSRLSLEEERLRQSLQRLDNELKDHNRRVAALEAGNAHVPTAGSSKRAVPVHAPAPTSTASPAAGLGASRGNNSGSGYASSGYGYGAAAAAPTAAAVAPAARPVIHAPRAGEVPSTRQRGDTIGRSNRDATAAPSASFKSAGGVVEVSEAAARFLFS